MRRVLTLAAGLCAVAGTGCSSARYVQRGSADGVVAVPNRSNDWPSYNYNKAVELITQHVGPDYEIVHEGEVETGSVTTHDQQVNREGVFNTSMPILPAEKITTVNTATTRATTEYRITYRRRATTPVAAATTPPAAPPVQPAGGVIPSVLPGGR
jgi:hypothetical protein